ncbi:hypothetical protein K470DRAFT_265876 [Piedraia hortae CBS 480.64]|uniref:ARID domain-containing protein n=1 Tax=Piedraia hortae CBS 480.64 TaxID=1314780 RepID=A0A6A7BVY9_9PEZI|nr:hypothetical protein K470DRAFT_265876 [Piedraia hortae CBS 480.64]
MAPKRGDSIESSDEREEFITKVGEFHRQRGTLFDPAPKVGVRHLDLYRLYQRVVEEGGYDQCSDTKAKPLMWRKLAEEFIGKNQYTTAQAFQVKNVYYKNLCAYEIKAYWGKEPPPKEILEEVTAKGGNVMNRTLENYVRAPQRDRQDDDEAEGPEMRTPKPEADGEEPGSAARSTRGLRPAPAQRTANQPETANKSSRNAVQVAAGQTAVINGASAVASSEPSIPYPLSLRPVVTPANNAEYYINKRKRKAEAAAGPLANKRRNIMLPGTGFLGPNIYVRAQLALQSGLPNEEEYALHHLVKISHERGDRYRFEQFPGLAEALVKKALQVSSLFYDVDWEIGYENEEGDDVLNGLYGTPGIVRRLHSRALRLPEDGMLDEEQQAQLGRIIEAALVLRNMCMEALNSQYMARQPPLRDFLAVALNLPDHADIVELQHYALEIAEQVLPWCDLAADDELYGSLLVRVLGSDRGAIVISLRTISRIAMHLPGAKRLANVPVSIIRKIPQFLLVQDEELRSAALDFLFQYTNHAENVAFLLQSVCSAPLIRQLARFLLFESRETIHPVAIPAPTKPLSTVPVLSPQVIHSILAIPEPERSSRWLQMCFTPDKTGEMTQIELWKAYQTTFLPWNTTHPHLVAGEFIKNVSVVFPGAAAQVSAGNRYVMRGVRPRSTPLGPKQEAMEQCKWNDCGVWHIAKEILPHILRDHLNIRLKSNSPAENKDVEMADAEAGVTAEEQKKPSTLEETFDIAGTKEPEDLTCKWGGKCIRTLSFYDNVSPNAAVRLRFFIRHIATHLSPKSEKKSQRQGGIQSFKWRVFDLFVDEQGDVAGVPRGAALVLGNLARHAPVSIGTDVKERLFFILAHTKRFPALNDVLCGVK